jgi:hypothetical protein
LSNENLEYAIDSITTYINAAQQRNYERWPILGEYVWPNYDWQWNDYDDEVEYFETWFFNRIFWIDNNTPGSLLIPSADLSGYYPNIDLTLTDDYFSRQILKNKYFTLNDAPPGLEIDTVIYQNATTAKIYLTGNVNSSAEISVTIKDKILNSFEDLTSGTFSIYVGIDKFEKPEVNFYSTSTAIHLECKQPELLGDKIEIFNLSGQLIQSAEIQVSQLNNVSINITPGIYLCSFIFDEVRQTRRVVFVR